MSNDGWTLRGQVPWPGAADALLAAAAVLGPLLIASAVGGPPPPPDPLAVVARMVAALAAWRLLRALDAAAPAAWCAAALYAAASLRDHAPAGAGLALLLLAVAVARQDRRRALACAAGGVALALGGHDAQAGALTLAAVAPWAAWRLTAVPSGWDAHAAAPLLGGGAIGALLTLPVWWHAPGAPSAVAGESSNWRAMAPVVAALALATLALGRSRRHRALHGTLALWLALYAGRGAGVPLASFVVDIVAPMPDPAFLARASSGLVLAVLTLAALAPADRLWLRTAAGVLALSGVAASVFGGPETPTTYDVAYGAVIHQRPLALAPGQSVGGMIPGPAVRAGSVRRLGIEIGTYLGAADGRLALTLCAAALCRSGEARIAGAADNAVLSVTLDPPLQTYAGAALRWQASHVDGRAAVAVWLGQAPGDWLDGPDGSIAASAHVVLGYAADSPPPVLAP